ICTLIVFGLIGWFQPHNNGSQEAITDIIQGLESTFTLNWTVFLPAAVLLVMLFFRLPRTWQFSAAYYLAVRSRLRSREPQSTRLSPSCPLVLASPPVSRGLIH